MTSSGSVTKHECSDPAGHCTCYNRQGYGKCCSCGATNHNPERAVVEGTLPSNERCPHGISLTANPPCHFCEHQRLREAAIAACSAMGCFCVGDREDVAPEKRCEMCKLSALLSGDGPVHETSGIPIRYPGDNLKSHVFSLSSEPTFITQPQDRIERLDVRGDKLYLIVKYAEETSALLAKLEELGKLPQNWDSYGALPLHPQCVAKAREIGASLPDPDKWSAVPMCNGGVQIEQHRGGLDIELVIETSPEKASAQLHKPCLDSAVGEAIKVHGLPLRPCGDGCTGCDYCRQPSDTPVEKATADRFECTCLPSGRETCTAGGPPFWTMCKTCGGVVNGSVNAAISNKEE